MKLNTKQLTNFWSYVDKTAPNGCWKWLGSWSGEDYGIFGVNGKLKRVHRISWILVNGAIPDGLDILHKCDNRRCLNPDHLFIGTHQDNMTDKSEKYRAKYNGLCKRGHDNWKVTSEGHRHCRTCLSIANKVKKQKKLEGS